MTHDTSRDSRILLAQRACTVLRQCLQRKIAARPKLAKERVAALAGAAESAVMTMMYLYQPPSELASSVAMGELLAAAANLGDALTQVLTHRETPPLLRLTMRWCLRILSGLPRRLSTSGATLASGVDLVVVEVRNVTRIGQLWLTRVSDGAQDYTVVTNLPGIRARDKLAVAFLPPREVGGEVSEAMFVGDDRLAEPAGTLLDESRIDSREVSALLHDELAQR